MSQKNCLPATAHIFPIMIMIMVIFMNDNNDEYNSNSNSDDNNDNDKYCSICQLDKSRCEHEIQSIHKNTILEWYLLQLAQGGYCP